jgi:hypothetical protein
MRGSRKPIEISPASLWQGTLAAAALVFMFAGVLIVGGEQYPGLDFVGLGLVVAYLAALVAIVRGMDLNRDRKVVLIRIPLYSDPLGPNQGWDPRVIDAARRRAMHDDGTPKIG